MKIVFADDKGSVIASINVVAARSDEPEIIMAVTKFIQKEVGDGNKSDSDKLSDRIEHHNRKRTGGQPV